MRKPAKGLDSATRIASLTTSGEIRLDSRKTPYNANAGRVVDHSLKDPLVGIQTGTACKCRGPLNHYPAPTQHGGSHTTNPMKLRKRLLLKKQGNHLTAYPTHYYRDPIEAAMMAQSKRCDGCRHHGKLLGREFCAIGRRELRKCKKYKERR